MNTPTPLVDVHAHFLTPRYLQEAGEAGHLRPDGMAAWPTWNAARHLELMDEWSIATSMLSISSPGTHFGDDEAARALTRHVNETGAELKRIRPDRFGHFASLPLPDVDGALVELAHAMDQLGSDGVTVKTNAHGTYLGDLRYEPLLAELDRRRTPVFVHPTSPPHQEAVSLGRPRPMLEFLFDSARTVSDLVFNRRLQQYPNIPWIFTHGGGTLPLLTQRMELFRSVFGSTDDTAADTTPLDPIPEQVNRLWFDIAGTPFPHQVPCLTAAFGTDRLLYGSDYCFTPAAGTAAQIASVDAAPQPGQDTWRTLTTRNAHRLFP
ncbi:MULTISPECIES: amidohydrolase family protein [unclassified Streptomyces]|uniref:amidohydrolase family protein n=1 Tax=unclassified Streptomyces TaxID=2593676 RepID=UPI0035DAD44F